MSRGLFRIAAAYSAALCVLACAGPPAETMTAVDPLGWVPTDTAVITVDNIDTATMRTISLLMSYNDDFEGGGLPVQVMVGAPDGKYYSEQFVIYESDDRRKDGDFHESLMPYRDSVVFGMAGRYVFRILPLQEIEGVRAVGIKIE
jgi:hypothetical protein